jgi:hypothetical protein
MITPLRSFLWSLLENKGFEQTFKQQPTKDYAAYFP